MTIAMLEVTSLFLRFLVSILYVCVVILRLVCKSINALNKFRKSHPQVPTCYFSFAVAPCVRVSSHSVLVSVQAWARTEGGLIRTMASHVSNLFQKTRETRQAQTIKKLCSQDQTCFQLLVLVKKWLAPISDSECLFR